MIIKLLITLQWTVIQDSNNQKEYYSRLKSKYRRLSKVDISDEDVISEIDMKINEVVLSEKSM